MSMEHWWNDTDRGKLKGRREDNIKMGLKEIGWEGMDWIVSG